MEAMHHMRPRLQGCPVHDPETMDILSQCNEIQESLERDEEKLIHDEKEADMKFKEQLALLHEQYRERMVLFGDVKPPADKKAKIEPRDFLKETEDDMIDQKIVKGYFPPSTAVWKKRGTRSWAAQVKGWPKEISRTVNQRGEWKAVQLAASEAWYQHCILAGKRYEDAPFIGLAPVDEFIN